MVDMISLAKVMKLVMMVKVKEGHPEYYPELACVAFDLGNEGIILINSRPIEALSQNCMLAYYPDSCILHL